MKNLLLLAVLLSGCVSQPATVVTAPKPVTVAPLAMPMPTMVADSARSESAPPAGESVHLVFDASPSPQVTGYKIYQGSSTNEMTGVIDVGNVTNVVISGLTWPVHFAATAYDENGVESEFSNFAGVTGVETVDIVYAQTNANLAIDQWADAFKVVSVTNAAPNFYRVRAWRSVNRKTYP
jgi:PBP1b-binding outer membrane lipoprotein LpoB